MQCPIKDTVTSWPWYVPRDDRLGCCVDGSYSVQAPGASQCCVEDTPDHLSLRPAPKACCCRPLPWRRPGLRSPVWAQKDTFAHERPRAARRISGDGVGRRDLAGQGDAERCAEFELHSLRRAPSPTAAGWAISTGRHLHTSQGGEGYLRDCFGAVSRPVRPLSRHTIISMAADGEYGDARDRRYKEDDEGVCLADCQTCEMPHAP